MILIAEQQTAACGAAWQLSSLQDDPDRLMIPSGVLYFSNAKCAKALAAHGNLDGLCGGLGQNALMIELKGQEARHHEDEVIILAFELYAMLRVLQEAEDSRAIGQHRHTDLVQLIALD
jgi:hypothetical protein